MNTGATNSKLRFDREEFVTRGDAPFDEQLADGVELLVLAAGGKGAKGMCTALATVAPGASIPYHRHSCGEVMVVLQGEVMAESEGRQYQLGKYDAFFVPAGVNHSVCNRSTGVAQLHVSFPNPAPDRILYEAAYTQESREGTDDSTPEKLIRFQDAEVYELAENTAFRDLFASRFGSAGVCGGYGRFAPGASLPCHLHDYDESISIVEGTAICQVAGKEHTLSHNDTACIPRGRPHRFLNRSDQPMAMIWVYAGDEPDREILDQCHCASPPMG